MSGPGGETNDLTDQQRLPLNVRGASVALSAGAGCGKTTVLTARFLRDLEGPELRSLRSIVALTFTEKSARELRQRIRSECRAKLSAGEDPARWRDVLRALEAAPIGTFHQFCGAWLRRHHVAAGIDPDFAVLDDTIAGAVRDEALARCLRRKLADNDPDLIALAVEFGMRNVREALADLLSERSAGDLADWVQRTPEEVVNLWKTAWEDHERPALFGKVCTAARHSRDLLADQEFTNPRLQTLRGTFLEMVPEESDEQLAALREAALLPKGLRKEHWPSPEANEAVKESLKKLRDSIDDYRKKCEWSAEAALLAAEHGLRFARLLLDARTVYDARKRARGGLDFDDLLLKTRALLADPDALTQADPPEEIALLLVDEFQDTDPVQSAILRSLGGDQFRQGRLFVVGDAKQSIYRFRGAQPGIFEEFRAAFPHEGGLVLTENFRSVPGILNFVNALFHGVFSDSAPKLDPRVATVAERPVVEFLWAVEPENGDEPKGKPRENRQLEARWLARHLRGRLAEHWPIRDRKTREVRQAHAGDIAFLFRALTDVRTYERALADEGFDYHTTGGSTFYAQQEVGDLINLLSVLEDPLDPVALAGALRSPFFCLSDDGLYWLATARRDLPEGLQHAEAIAELAEDDRHAAARARDLLERWRAFKDHGPIAALVDRVLDESGYEAALLGEFLGERKRANARKLVRLAREFDEQGGFTLADFVARLRNSLRNPPREEQAATSDEEGRSIRLMTVHQAKGLEFPIVVLPDLNRAFPGSRRALVFDPNLGPLVRLSQDFESDAGGDDGNVIAGESLGWRVYAAREQREEEAEALRLFYVATTRARDALILSAGIAPDQAARSPALKQLDRAFDRRTGACRVSLPEGWEGPQVQVVLDPPAPAGQARERLAAPPLRAVARAIRETAASLDHPSPTRLTDREFGVRVLHPLPWERVAAQPPGEGASGTGYAGRESALTRPLRGHPLPEGEGENVSGGQLGGPGQARPRFVDLDPALGLAPGAARLDRLIRAILADPQGLSTAELSRVARQAARKQTPAAHSGLVDDAVSRLLPRLNGALGQWLDGAQDLRRAVPWTLAWPPEGAPATIFQGRTDLVCRDGQGDWQLINVSDASAPDARERLRLLLSAHAADRTGCGPIRQAWRVRLGPGGGLHGEECWDVAAIAVAIQEMSDDT